MFVQSKVDLPTNIRSTEEKEDEEPELLPAWIDDDEQVQQNEPTLMYLHFYNLTLLANPQC